MKIFSSQENPLKLLSVPAALFAKASTRHSQPFLDFQLDNLALSIKFLAQIFRGVKSVKRVDLQNWLNIFNHTMFLMFL